MENKPEHMELKIKITEDKPKKLTIQDIIGFETINNNQQYIYKTANNQKQYSHTQKIKP